MNARGPSERRRLHGPLRPMEREPDPSWLRIALAVAALGAVALFLSWCGDIRVVGQSGTLAEGRASPERHMEAGRGR